MTAFLVDRSDRLRMLFTGDKAKEALGGLVTNDVVKLTAGQGQRAVALTPKGRVIALLRVFDRGSDLLVDSEAASGDAFVAMIRKFVNPRLAKYSVVTDTTRCLGIYGDDAAARLAAAAGVAADALTALAPFGIVRGSHGATETAAAGTSAAASAAASENPAGHALDIVRSTDLSVPGFDVMGAPEAIAALETALRAQGLEYAPAEAVEIARVEAGLPRFGTDMDGETIPQEANLDTLGAISFNKGCYTGQEVVARIHFRGHVNRHLRWLSASEPLPVGAKVHDSTGKEVGDVRSSVLSPARGPLALAMVRREIEPGSDVQVRAEGRELTARCEAIA
jgi:tRNA-modifying protein YgfZ